MHSFEVLLVCKCVDHNTFNMKLDIPSYKKCT